MNQTASTGLINRTLANLRIAWRGLTSSGHEIKPLNLGPDLPDSDVTILKKLMQECVEAKGGEVSSRARAAVLGQAYLSLNDRGKIKYLEILVKDFAVSNESITEVKQKIEELENNPDLVSTIRDLLIPPRIKLLTRFNDLPQGVKFLVDLRADIRFFMNSVPALKSLDYDLRRLLKSWFDIGFLELKRITWNEPAALLEKLIEYEAVHEISSWSDLRNRLDEDRRCYAFFHPSMPDEPLIFIEVALVKGIAASIQTLLDEQEKPLDPKDADTAIFYSITNTQMGLQGIHFGGFLIKQVVDQLVMDLPNLNTFATLSPVPGFTDFINRLPDEKEKQILSEREQVELRELFGLESIKEILTNIDRLQNLVDSDTIKNILMKICAWYLVKEKRGQRALNPVADFHLNNGARLENINWMADVSEHGLRQSAGIMVNYVYKLSDIEKNHERYSDTGNIATSGNVTGLLKSID